MSDAASKGNGNQSREWEAHFDQVCDRFEAAWKEALAGRGDAPRVEDFLGDAAHAERSQLHNELLALDKEYRANLDLHATVSRQADPDPFLEAPAKQEESPQQTVAYIPSGEQAGTVLAGRYKLLEQIGEGGMGTVWVAEQTRPVRRKVAVKLIKAGMDSKAILSRFEAERQALAMMDHPNIAKVLDGGTTGEPDASARVGAPLAYASGSGRPFFVMEYVKGIPFTKYCDDARLSVAERLALFLPVCQAVQHAHQKGIIHRDLKPSNILVCLYDGKPVPKVIDFGLAKAMHQPLTEHTLYTAHGALMGTPLYMSPEQAEVNNLDVDTRTDIYALGVILYELLTGTTPLEKQRMKEAAYLEMLRLIKEEEPPVPSARLSSSETLASAAAQRHLEPAKLTKLVRGELDWIVMRCLEKDRSRRYETANGLARDVERYLADEVVEARPPSAGYRLRKLLRRHKGPVLAASLLVLTLLAGIIGTTLGLIEAKWQEGLAVTAQNDALGQKNLAESKEQEAKNESIKAKQARDEKAANLYISQMNLVQREYEANNLDNVRDLLDRQIPKDHDASDFRHFEWHYWYRLSRHRERLTLQGHAGVVVSVAWSPDGKRIASGNEDGTVRVWDAETGQETIILKGHKDYSVYCVAFSPDGKRIVSGGRDNRSNLGELKVWDAATGQETITLKAHTVGVINEVWSVAWSGDGKRIVSGSYDKTLKVWDAATGRETLTLSGHTGGVTSVAWSGDGKRIVSCSGEITDPFKPGELKVWNTATGQDTRTINGAYRSVAWSPDGSRIVSGSVDNTLKVWDATTGQETLNLKGHELPIMSVAWISDGKRIVSGSADKTLKVWDAATGKEIITLKGHTEPVSCVGWSRDGKRIVSGSYDETLRVWDAGTGQETLSFEGHMAQVLTVAWSGDGKRIVSGGYGYLGQGSGLKVWDAATGQETITIKGHTIGGVRSVASSPDGKLIVSGNWDNKLKVWDAATSQETLTRTGHTKEVTSVAWSGDGKRIVSGSDDGTLKVWDAATFQESLTIKGGTGPVAWSPDGCRIVSGSVDNTLKVWDATTGQETLTIKRLTKKLGTNPIICVAWSPDGKWIGGGSGDKTLKVWDAATGQETFTLNGHTQKVWGLAWSGDGKRIVSGSLDNTVKVWDAATGQETLTLKGHTGGVTSVAWSGDGKRIVSGSMDGTVKVWEVSLPAQEVLDKRRIASEVQKLYSNLGLKEEVLAELNRDVSLRQQDREKALQIAQQHVENPFLLDDFAWNAVKKPGQNRKSYSLALRQAKAAVHLEPKDSRFRKAQGVAEYRLGFYAEADSTLAMLDIMHSRSADPAVRYADQGNPGELAFLAMVKHRLGKKDEAQAAMKKLRELMKMPQWAKNEEAQAFLKEAEAVLKEPAGK